MQFLRALVLFYGVSLLLSGVGMAAYCLASDNPFPTRQGQDAVMDIRMFYLTAGPVMTVGLGSMLIWWGIGRPARKSALSGLRRLGQLLLEA